MSEFAATTSWERKRARLSHDRIKNGLLIRANALNNMISGHAKDPRSALPLLLEVVDYCAPLIRDTRALLNDYVASSTLQERRRAGALAHSLPADFDIVATGLEPLGRELARSKVHPALMTCDRVEEAGQLLLQDVDASDPSDKQLSGQVRSSWQALYDCFLELRSELYRMKSP